MMELLVTSRMGPLYYDKAFVITSSISKERVSYCWVANAIYKTFVNAVDMDTLEDGMRLGRGGKQQGDIREHNVPRS